MQESFEGTFQSDDPELLEWFSETLDAMQTVTDMVVDQLVQGDGPLGIFPTDVTFDEATRRRELRDRARSDVMVNPL